MFLQGTARSPAGRLCATHVAPRWWCRRRRRRRAGCLQRPRSPTSSRDIPNRPLVSLGVSPLPDSSPISGGEDAAAGTEVGRLVAHDPAVQRVGYETPFGENAQGLPMSTRRLQTRPDGGSFIIDPTAAEPATRNEPSSTRLLTDSRNSRRRQVTRPGTVRCDDLGLRAGRRREGRTQARGSSSAMAHRRAVKRSPYAGLRSLRWQAGSPAGANMEPMTDLNRPAGARQPSIPTCSADPDLRPPQ